MPRHPDRTPLRISESPDPAARTATGSTGSRIVDFIDIVVGAGASAGDAGSADGIRRFVSKRRLLPTFARTYTSHEAIARGIPSDPLGRVMRSLEGKFVVANRPFSAALPNSVREVVAEVEALCRRSVRVRRISISLAEPATAVIGRAVGGGAIVDETSPPGFFAMLPYQLTIAIGAETPAIAQRLHEAARTIAARLTAEPIDWFNLALCIPDGDAIRQMSDDAALFYRGITGRLGAGTPERYWHLDAWEQYTEPGRMHGFIVPDMLRLPPYSARSLPHEEETAEDPPTYGSSLWPRLTSRLVKRALIPPGYCFVEFWARLSVDVCGIGGDSPARGPREGLPRA